jgi:AcrR family transcriptional regulator
LSVPAALPRKTKPVRPQPGATHLDQILDAAEAVVLRDGMGRLTLDAAARQAGLSKAGLLHHVPSKDALIGAMVRRHVEAWHASFLESYRGLRGSGHPSPAVGAMLATCLAGPECWNDAERARSRVMVAALVHDERQVEPLRRVHREVSALVRQDELPRGVGDVIHLAVHGLWFQWIFGMGEISTPRLRDVRSSLEALGRGGDRGRAEKKGEAR